MNSSRWKSPFQKTKRERHQPANREGVGFLEKKKDYLKRAERAHRKQKFVSDLRKEVAQKNPDEFYFSMITDVKQRKLETKSKPLREFNKEQRLLLETRDQLYIQSKLTSHKRKLEALKQKVPARPRESTKIFATVEEAREYQKRRKEEEALEETPEIRALKEEIAERQRIVNELQEVLDEMQLQKDLNDGQATRLEDDEGNVSFVWEKERKR